MKKYYSILLVAMALLFSIASCQKNDESLVNNNETVFSSLNTNSRGDDDQIRAIDPSQVYSSLNSLYGDWFYVSSDSLKSARYYYAENSFDYVMVWVFPCQWVNYNYLTVVITPSLQIKGIYILSYHTSKQNDGMESNGYEFEVFDPEGIAYPNCFTGCAITNYYPPHPDTFTVYNWGIDIPSTYPYPLFDNIAVGTVGLVTCSNNGVYNEYINIALRIGSTIYINYCGS